MKIKSKIIQNGMGKTCMLAHITIFSALEGEFGSSADTSGHCAPVIKEDIMSAVIENRYWPLLFI